MQQGKVESHKNDDIWKDFQIKVLQNGDVEQCGKLIAESFSKIEPFKGLAMTTQELMPIYYEISLKSVERQHSFVVRHQQTRKIASCCISFDAMDDSKIKKDTFLDPSKYQAITALLFQMTEQYEKNFPFQVEGEAAFIWDLAVAPQFRGRKLVRLMLEETIKTFKKQKYKEAFVEMVSPFTVQTFVHSSKFFQVVNTVKMKDFESKGKKLWENSDEQCTFAKCNLESINL